MNALVSINGQNVPVIHYRGQRVITLAQMDTLHHRAKGTAKRNFAEHRNKLIVGEDYFRIGSGELAEVTTSDEFRTYSVGRGGKLTQSPIASASIKAQSRWISQRLVPCIKFGRRCVRFRWPDVERAGW
jgi:hypothetical protein